MNQILVLLVVRTQGVQRGEEHRFQKFVRKLVLAGIIRFHCRDKQALTLELRKRIANRLPIGSALAIPICESPPPTEFSPLGISRWAEKFWKLEGIIGYPD